MKHFLSYCLLAVTLMLGITGIGANVWNKVLIGLDRPTAVISHDESEHTASDYFITALDQPFIPVEITRTAQPNILSTATKEEVNFHNSYLFRFSQLTVQHLHTTKSAYDLLYAEKQKSGYYIYSLRKLLI